MPIAFRCPVCLQGLVQHDGEHICTYCNAIERAEYVCPSHHYQCEACRLADAETIVARVCEAACERNPIEIVNLIMTHPSFADHGVQHHYVVAPAVITAMDNAGMLAGKRPSVESMISRVHDVPAGSCGNRGDCGACIGAGEVVAIIANANPMRGRPRSMVLTACANALLHVASMGGIRCCKQSVYAAIETTDDVLRRSFNMSLLTSPICCCFADRLTDCKREQCPYFSGL
jgi:hypothetical protein